jgi:hypothetical protein
LGMEVVVIDHHESDDGVDAPFIDLKATIYWTLWSWSSLEVFSVSSRWLILRCNRHRSSCYSSWCCTFS